MEAPIYQLYLLCRTCMQDLNTSKIVDSAIGINIFETPNLAEKLAACTSSEVLVTDDNPKVICSSCYQKVNDFYQFREMCMESLQRFKQLQQRQKLLHFEDEMPISIHYGLVEENNLLETTNNRTDQVFKCVKDHTHHTIGEILERQCSADNYLEQEIFAEVAKNVANALMEADVLDNSSNIESSNEHRQSDDEDSLNKLNSKSRKKSTRSVTANPSAIYRCDICSARFFVEHRLIAHKREHEGLKPYPCAHDGCEQAFNRRNALSRHLQQHEGQQFLYACEQEGCDKVYKHKPTLVMHQRKYHKLGPELKSHICEICGKIFKTSTMLNDHRYTHKDKSERPYACDQTDCTRRFANKDKLKVHLMRHAGIRNYVCPHCGMRKTTMNELKVHINYHTLERTWPCRFCTHICNSAGNLKTHVRTVHERAKDYACRHCARTFAKPDTRKYHEMTHTGEKPNVCAECGKRFLQPAALRTHRKIHQRENVRGAKAKTRGRNKATAAEAGTVPKEATVSMGGVQRKDVESLTDESAAKNDG